MLKFDNPTLVTITAPTCSGKSFLLDTLTAPAATGSCPRIVSTTTRARRDGEVEGVDYFFISDEESRELEAANAFFELIEFRGTRYGVTRGEMDGKMREEFAPVVILEPKGLAIYEQKCRENGWDIYKVYVATVEATRIQRLNTRTANELHRVISNLTPPSSSTYAAAFASVAAENAYASVPKIINTHTDRLLSITGEERGWSNTQIWDAVIPGDDVVTALDMLLRGVKWRNRQRGEPRAIGAVKLPL